MGFTKKQKGPAGVWVPEDITGGEISLADLRRNIEIDQENCNKFNVATWPESHSLTADEIKTLDGTNAVEKPGARDAIGCPVSLQTTGDPAGFKSGTSQYYKTQPGCPATNSDSND